MTREIQMIPNENDLVLKIESVLKYDNLYNLIIDREQLKKELFHPVFISALEEDIHRWYSVAEAGRIIGGDKPIPPSTLTYYIDSLKEYIVPDDAPSNKYIRLNYLSLVKMKMVLLLKDEFRLNGIKAEVGITGNPKNVVQNTGSNTPSLNDDEYEILKGKVEKYEAVNEMLLRLLVEKGEDGQVQLKKPLHLLLSGETPLLEEHSAVTKKVEEQSVLIESLLEENKQLIERIEKAESLTTEFDHKFTQSENDRAKILESEKKISSLTESMRARQQAEEEWDKQSLLKKMRGNKSEFISFRIKEILNNKNDNE